MARYLDSRFGKIRPFKGNPRTISDAAFTKLCASIERDPEFMETRPIVIDENNEILGGNQRQFALLELGYEKVPDNWIRQVTGWPLEKKQRFVLIDNSPEGMAGEFDYDVMSDNFSSEVMAAAGIDFANLGEDIQFETGKTAEDKAETSDYGEKSDKLQQFKEHREKARESLDEMTDSSFYLCVIFQSTEQKRAFIEKAQLVTDGELFASGLSLADKMGIALDQTEFKFPEAKRDQVLEGMAMENDQEPVGATGNGASVEESAAASDTIRHDKTSTKANGEPKSVGKEDAGDGVFIAEELDFGEGQT